jgi:hypothetical protein
LLQTQHLEQTLDKGHDSVDILIHSKRFEHEIEVHCLFGARDEARIKERIVERLVESILHNDPLFGNLEDQVERLYRRVERGRMGDFEQHLNVRRKAR